MLIQAGIHPVILKYFLRQREACFIGLLVLSIYGIFHVDNAFRNNERFVFDKMQQKLLNETTKQLNVTVWSNIRGLQTALEEYLADIQDLRQSVLARDDDVQEFQDWMKYMYGKHHELHFQMQGYFDIVSRGFPFVKMEYLKNDLQSIVPFLNKDYFNYASNNCESLANTTPGPVKYYKETYNAICGRSFNATLKSNTLYERLKSLDIALPIGYEATGRSGADSRRWAYIHLIKDVDIGQYGRVSSKNVSLYSYGCHRIIDFSLFPSHYDEVFTINGVCGHRVYHFTVEDLPRISPYLPFLMANPRIKVHVGRKSSFLSLLGLHPDRLVTGRVKARLAYVPSAFPCGTSDVFHLQLLSYYLRRNLPNKSTDRDSIVLIKRSSPQRQFKHHFGILSMLQQEARKRKLKVHVYPDDPVPSLFVTQEMFNSAVMVVAPHGAGLSNVVFCQPGTVIIEGMNHRDQTRATNMCYTSLALALGLRYYGVYFEHKSLLDYTADDLRGPVQNYLDHLDVILQA